MARGSRDRVTFQARPCAPMNRLIPCRMRAMGPPRSTLQQGLVAAFCALIASGAAGCGGSTPMDMWISRDPDAGAGFEAPVREVRPSDTASETTDVGAADDGAGDAGGTTGAAGTGGGAGSGGNGGAGGGAAGGTGG